jgi:GNAT superfamily N-acetyltransferase
MKIQCTGIPGSESGPYLEQLARLRCAVFREYPYLYDGDAEAEKKYLSNYSNSDRVFLVIAESEGQVVGVSTCMAMTEADYAFRKPFEGAEHPLEEICFFGESVLRPEFRRQGIGHRFFDLREQWAATRGFSINAFCSVIRAEDHPKKPADFRSYDSFWKKRGYQPDERFIAELEWREIDSGHSDVPHRLIYWMQADS